MYARTESLGAGIALSWANRLLRFSASTGADAVTQHAGRKPFQRRILQMTIRARRRAVCSLIKPNKRFDKSADGFRLHQPASLLINKKSLPDISIQSKQLVQHPGALSDYNNGATLIRAKMMHTHHLSDTTVFQPRSPLRHRKRAVRVSLRLRVA
jgi:hypothetical protein